MGSVKTLNPNAEVMGRNAALFMNINAAKGLYEVMKTNFGPKGTIKMLVGGAGGAAPDAGGWGVAGMQAGARARRARSGAHARYGSHAATGKPPLWMRAGRSWHIRATQGEPRPCAPCQLAAPAAPLRARPCPTPPPDIKLTKDGNVLLREMQIQNPTAVMIARTAVAQDDVTGCATAEGGRATWPF